MCGTRDKSAHTSIIINAVSTIHKVSERKSSSNVPHTAAREMRPFFQMTSSQQKKKMLKAHSRKA